MEIDDNNPPLNDNNPPLNDGSNLNVVSSFRDMESYWAADTLPVNRLQSIYRKFIASHLHLAPRLRRLCITVAKLGKQEIKLIEKSTNLWSLELRFILRDVPPGGAYAHDPNSAEPINLPATLDFLLVDVQQNLTFERSFAFPATNNLRRLVLCNVPHANRLLPDNEMTNLIWSRLQSLTLLEQSTLNNSLSEPAWRQLVAGHQLQRLHINVDSIDDDIVRRFGELDSLTRLIITLGGSHGNFTRDGGGQLLQRLEQLRARVAERNAQRRRENRGEPTLFVIESLVVNELTTDQLGVLLGGDPLRQQGGRQRGIGLAMPGGVQQQGLNRSNLFRKYVESPHRDAVFECQSLQFGALHLGAELLVQLFDQQPLDVGRSMVQVQVLVFNAPDLNQEHLEQLIRSLANLKRLVFRSNCNLNQAFFNGLPELRPALSELLIDLQPNVAAAAVNPFTFDFISRFAYLTLFNTNVNLPNTLLGSLRALKYLEELQFAAGTNAWFMWLSPEDTYHLQSTGGEGGEVRAIIGPNNGYKTLLGVINRLIKQIDADAAADRAAADRAARAPARRRH